MREIPLANGRGIVLVDDADHDWLNQYKWSLSGKYYAGSVYRENGGYRVRLMHRLILNAPAGMQVDHIDHNRLNNTRANLRLATNAQNQANRGVSHARSGYRGVWFHAGRWRAGLTHHHKHYHFGRFDTVEEAAAAYAEGARRIFGEFANPCRTRDVA